MEAGLVCLARQLVNGMNFFCDKISSRLTRQPGIIIIKLYLHDLNTGIAKRNRKYINVN